MKLAIVLCAVLGLSLGAVLPNGGQRPLVQHYDARNLGDLLSELMKLIPVDEVVGIIQEHMKNDPEVQDAVKYLESDDFKKIVTTVDGMQEFKDFVKYLFDSGLDIYTYINFINDLLGLPHVAPLQSQKLVIPKSILGMVFEILAVLPIDEIEAFYHDKVENNPDFIHLLERMRSPEFKEIVDKLHSMPEYTELLDNLRKNGVPVDEVVKAIDNYFGWGRINFRSTRNLGDLFDQLMALIPKEKILEIILNHVQNDPEVQEAIAYLKSDDFKKIVTTVQGLPAFTDFVKYLYDSGLDIYTYVNDFNNMFGLPTIRPPTVRKTAHQRSIMTMVNEILAVLPMDEINKFYHDKLENNPDFINLINRLKSPDFQTIVNTLHNLHEYQDMLNRLKSHGIPVDEIKSAIDHFFGWGTRSARSHLDDLFKEFMAMIPIDKILGIVAQHLQNDPEVQEAFAYLKSDDFKKIVMAVDDSAAFKDLLDFIYKAGIDIYAYINMIHDIFGLPHVNPPATRRLVQSRTLLGMIDEILAILPLQEMEDFYNNKLKNDPDFQALLAKLESPEFAKLVADVKAMPEYQNMLALLKSHGIDVDAIQKEIDHFFGWGTRSARSHLDDLFKEFMAMIPIDKILGIVAQHLQNDPEVQEAFAYLKSDDFKKIVMAVDDSAAFKDLLDFIYKAGIDIYAYINMIHDIFGLPHVNPPATRRLVQSRTLLGMIDEILAILPLQEMEDFYNNKLKNDPDFQALLAKLESPEFAKLVADVKAMPEYQNMLALLKSHGIDVDAIQKEIDHFFGWGTRSARSHLDDLFKEFMAMIPIDKILGIVAQHLQNDPEVQEAFAYLKSDDFKKIVMAVDDSAAFKDLLDFIYKAGIDIYAYINMIHDIFGLPHVNPPATRRLVQSRTLLGMIDEILAILPLQEMEDFYNNKLKNDPDFQALLAKLESPEFAKLVADVKAMPEYQNMLALLKSHGIDVDAIQKEIDHFFGWGTRSARSHLDDLFKEFMAMIPIDKILGIVAQHLQNDPEVQEAFAYLKSDDFKKIVMAVDDSAAFKDLLDFIYKAGIDIYAYINMIHDIFGLPHVNPPATRRLVQSRTLLGMIDEILAILPLQEMEDFYNNKLKNDPDFQALLAKLESPEFAKLVADVKAMPEYQNMLALLKSHGIDVDAIQKEIDHFFGWGTRSARSHLDDLFKEFMAMIPIDKILGIVAQHLQNDPEVQEAFAYLKSDDFKKIVMAVDDSAAFKDLLDFIYKAGIDIYAYINMIHDIFGLPHVNPPATRRLVQSRTLLGMIDEILAILPLQEMEDFYNNKLKNDPDFQALLAKLESPEFAKLVADVKAMPEYQNMLALLKSHGIDVDAIQKEIDHFFGWGTRSARSHLDDLFKEFMAMIPIDKILGIVAQHLQNDPEVQEAFAYLKSDDFKKIVMAVDDSAAFKDLLDFIYKAGIDIYAYINMIHDIFGLPHVNPPATRRLVQSRTLLGMIDEILAILPLQEMEDFYNNKLKNDPDFQALLAKLESPEFAKLVADVKAMPEYQNMLALLKSHGIDVDAIQKEIDHFFGWGTRSARSHLDDLFKEFMAMIPIDKILGIVAQHLQNDPEVQEAFAYLKSDDFKKIVMAVDDSAAFKDLLDFIYKAGIDIYAYINMIHDIFGLPHVNPPATRRLVQSRTLLGMIDEILAILPLQEMEDFYNNKLKNDPDFQALLAKLESPEFAKLVADVKAMPEYQNMLALLKSHGIDVDAIQKEIDHFFGWGTRSARSHLDDLFKEFMAMIPIDKILGIVAQHLQNDPEVQEAFAYLKSDDFKKIVMAVDDSAAFKDLLDFIYKAGIDIYAYINMIHDIFGLPHVNPPATRRLVQSRTLLGMIDEILAILPLQEMEDFYNNKLKNDPDFQALLAKLESPEFAKLVADVKAMPEYQNMLALLKSHGIDVDAIQKEIDHFFGWGTRSARSHLDDLFKEFMAMIPIDKILGIVAQHLQNDPEVQEAFAYLKSDDFKKIVMAVDDSAAFKDLLDFIYKAGIDIYAYINMIHDIFGLPHVNPPATRRLVQSRTLLGMIDEILAILPLQEMEDFYNNKLKNDPDFQALLAKLESPEFAKLVADVKAMPEYQNMLALLKSHGIDVDAIQKEIDHFFGWGTRSARSHLDDLFKEFMAMIPIDKILGIVAQHLQNDPEVQEAFAYLKSDDFKKIVMAVDDSAAFKDLLDFIYKAGIDIYAYINMIHDIFGLPHVNPPATRRLVQSRTLLGMIDEILAILPLQEMEDFYNNKLKNDPDFQALLAKLESPEFAKLVADVKAMPEYQNMLALLKSHGIDVDAIQKEIDHFFGWGTRSARSHLDDLFKEFMAMIPIDKILGIVAQHLQNDPEVQEAFAYLKSDDFKKIVMAVDDSAAFKDLLDFIYKAGIDIYAYINMIHDIFGLPHVNPPATRRLVQSRTLLGMIDEILAILPLQEMEDFYNNKLKNDPDFQALLAKLESPEFAKLVADVKAMPEYQNMLALLKSHGIDVDAIQKEIDHFFGWGFY